MIRLSKNAVVSTIAGMAFLLSFLVFQSTAQNLEYKEKVIAGGPDKFAEVRHVVLEGSNFEIGKMIGEIAKKDGTSITPSDNPIMNRAKREYMAKNYPILHERMKGFAAAPGRTLWYAQYDLENLTLTVKFYLGEKPDPENEKKVILEYTSPQTYEIKN